MNHIPKTCYQNLFKFSSETQNCVNKITENQLIIKHLCLQILNGGVDIDNLESYDKEIESKLKENAELSKSVLEDYEYLIKD